MDTASPHTPAPRAQQKPRGPTGLEPAASIIHVLGGDTEVSRLVGVHRTRVSNWKRAKEHGGTGGFIPQRHHQTILASARECGKFREVVSKLFPSIESDSDERGQQ
ncbi:hypothetical+protein [Methylocapsa aurea]